MTATGRLGRYESAATIAGFAFSPLASIRGLVISWRRGADFCTVGAFRMVWA